MQNAEFVGATHEKVYVICKYNCSTPIEQSAISSHLHVCPNRPKVNEILNIIQQRDQNEIYIPQGNWPSDFPKTAEVLEYIYNSNLPPPLNLPPRENWVEVTHRVKKPNKSKKKPRRN